MKITVILLITFIDIFRQKIIPRGGKPIELSQNNKGMVSDYSFNFYLENDTVADCYLFIKFPAYDFPGFLAGNTCSAFLTLSSQAKSPVTCVINSLKWLKIDLMKIRAGSNNLIIVTVAGIQNPASTAKGTGYFQLEVRKGDFNVLAYNHFFSSIAFEENPLTMNNAVFLITGSKVINDQSNYKVTITLNSSAQEIKSNSKLSLKLPLFLTPAANFNVRLSIQNTVKYIYDVETHTVHLLELSANPSVSSFDVFLENCYNPSYATPSGTLDITFWRSNTNTVEQKYTIVDSDSFIASSFVSIKTKNFGLMNYVLSANDEIYYEFIMKVSNVIPEGAVIQIQLSTDFGIVSQCWPGKALRGISEASPVKCQVSGKTITTTNFRKILSYNEFSVGVQLINPSSTGITQAQTINIYKDVASMKLLYNASSLTFSIQNVKFFTQLTLFSLNLPANSLNTFRVDFQTAINLASTSTLTFTLKFLSKEFRVLGNLKCEFIINGVTSSATSFQKKNAGSLDILQLIISGKTFAANVLQSIVITPLDASSGIQSPSYAGQYGVEIQIDSTFSSENHHGTILIPITPVTLNLSTFKITPFTLDYEKTTTYKLSLYTPFSIPSGYWDMTDQLVNSLIEIVLPTQSGGQSLFKNYLGLDVAYSVDISKPSAVIPCYGLQNLFSSDSSNPNYLRCTVYFPDAIYPNSVRIQIDNFAAVSKSGQIELFIPKILNPTSITVAAQVQVNVYVRQNNIMKISLTGTINLALMKAHNIFANPNNSNGALGVPTNQQPKYFPSVINSDSHLEVKIVPSISLVQNDGMIVQVPFLPKTDPSSYLLPAFHKASCNMNGILTTCYSFREAAQIIVMFSTTLSINIETTFTIKNCKTPAYVSNIQDNNKIITFDQGYREVEEIILLPLDAFTWGSFLFSKVRPRYYEAIKVNVEYEWVFIVSNPIPPGGYVTLYFPANYYDLEHSVPCPQIQLKEGISFTDTNPAYITNCPSVYKSSIVTIKNINQLELSEQGYNKTLIVTWITGVKNPSVIGWTPYFGVTTHNKEGYVIDRDLEVPIIYISRVLESGKITFNKFECIPDNGKLLSNYIVEFYIETSIPKYGVIKVWFPRAEFSVGFSEENECQLGQGPLKTMLKCEFDNVFALVIITLDEDLEVKPGMGPISLRFPKVKNFNADLSSGIVKVTTYYDGTILDDSGSEDTNKKATTHEEADSLIIGLFEAYPTNEAAESSLKINFTPKHNVTDSSFIQIEFPKSFPRGLGKAINCTSQTLAIGVNDPLNCTVSDYTLTVARLKPTAGCPCNLDLIIRGIVLPNIEYQNNMGKIRMFFYENEKHVASFNDNIGSIALMSAPTPLIWKSSLFTSSEFATRADFNLKFSSPSSITFDRIRVFLETECYPDIMDIGTFVSLDNGSNVQANFTSLYFEYKLPSSVTLNPAIVKDFKLGNVWTSFKMSLTDFPRIALLNSNGILCQSFPNIIPEKSLNFPKVLNRIDLATSNTIVVLAGTYSYKLKTILDKPSDQQVDFFVESVHNYTTIRPPSFKKGFSESRVQIGCPLTKYNRETYFYMRPSSNSFYFSKPYKVFVDTEQKAMVSVDSYNSVVTGGFIGPIKVTLQYSPYTSLLFTIIIAGSSNATLATYPSQLNFTNTDTVKEFYIFDYYSSKSSFSKVFFSLEGEVSDVYRFVNNKNQLSLNIVNGKEIAPVLLETKHRLVQTSAEFFKLIVDIQLDSNCVIYYSIMPRGSMDISYTETSQKTLKYKFLAEEVFYGIGFTDAKHFNATLQINNITANKDFKLKLFFLNTDGVIAPAEFIYFSTRPAHHPIFLIFEVFNPQNTTTEAVDADIISLLNSTSIQLNYTFTNTTNSTAFDDFFDITKNSYTFENGKFILIPKEIVELPEDYDPEEAWTNKFGAILNVALSCVTTDIDTDTKHDYITNVEYNYAEELNSHNEVRNTLSYGTDLGYSDTDFVVIESKKNDFQNRLLPVLREGGYYDKVTRYHQITEADLNYMYKPTLISEIDNRVFRMVLIYPQPELNQTSEDLFYNIKDAFNKTTSQNSTLKDLHYYKPQLKKLKWSDINFPYIQNITDREVTISGIAVNQTAMINYIVVQPFRIDYRQNANLSNVFLYFNEFSSHENCTREDEHLLQIKCFPLPSDMDQAFTLNLNQYDIRNFTKIYEMPTGLQIRSGLDPNNFRVIKYGSVNTSVVGQYSLFTVDGLTRSNNYTIFMSLSAEVDNYLLELDQDDIVSMTFRTKDGPPVSTIDRIYCVLIGFVLLILQILLH